MIKDGFTMPCFICLVLLLNIDHENEYPHLRKNITHLSDSCHFTAEKSQYSAQTCYRNVHVYCNLLFVTYSL